MVPKQAFVTKGVGKHKHKLTSFEMALRNAKIAEYNLVRVSSIFPPHCKLVSRSAGLKQMSPGQVIFCVMSDNATNEPNRLIASSVGIAIPRDSSRYGYLSEHHSFGENDTVAGEYAEDLAADMLATILDAPFDPDKSYDEQKDIWKISGHIVKTRNITQSAVGDKNGLWTTVIAAIVFVL
ncbi:MAG: arginine decarboxylase, pyruvoyl-dependent [Candidatus Dadabacteria bacterium]|nr:arginine decarboxylase, pyruvoyl-dependent [Candidatus Dadabacteria bacterium]NIS09602.1 arginine decarboxylase, pyruvoyl-dependent [Candidatus Dadabacteria bacterium]NIV43181.1 arginine decarboxylase, pyruvoyl-dependent [Candidatus Dadabacteria bacterium]NIX16084.1 arginine decarboxylase, pyruvoyl-dependent [Candidatus Dadabacteria bacterium]NIY22774.1 arginine decarboxylase, pyruvoyl-dependent [Candidatus Dadabacteria bacterium]